MYIHAYLHRPAGVDECVWEFFSHPAAGELLLLRRSWPFAIACAARERSAEYGCDLKGTAVTSFPGDASILQPMQPRNSELPQSGRGNYVVRGLIRRLAHGQNDLHQLRQRAHAHLLHGVGTVQFDGTFADVQVDSHDLVGLAADDAFGNLALAQSQ